MMDDPTGGMGFDQFAWLQELPEQERAQVLSALNMPAKNEQLEKQQALALALASKQLPQRRTGLGAIYQGIGDLGGTIVGGIRAGDLQGQIDANSKALEDPKHPIFKARQMALARALASNQPTEDIDPSELMGY